MKKIALALALFAVAAPAAARHHHRQHHHRHRGVPWCGLYMMKLEGRHDPRLARAIEWRREGVAAGGPAIGVVVVWPHHVGKIVGQTARGEWIVHSGNDGGRVRTRPRSLRGAVAFRRV